MLERERVRGLQREERAEQEDGRDPERGGEQDRRDEQQRGDRLGRSGRELTPGDRTGTLDGVCPVMLHIADVVDEVTRARGRAVGAEGGQGLAPARGVAELCREDDPGEEKEVLRPLAGAERDDRGPDLRAAAR